MMDIELKLKDIGRSRKRNKGRKGKKGRIKMDDMRN